MWPAGVGGWVGGKLTTTSPPEPVGSKSVPSGFKLTHYELSGNDVIQPPPLPPNHPYATSTLPCASPHPLSCRGCGEVTLSSPHILLLVPI